MKTGKDSKKDTTKQEVLAEINKELKQYLIFS